MKTTTENYPQENSKIGIEEILSENDNILNTIEAGKENKGIFKVRTANKCIEDAKSRPIPKMLFGELWFENQF